MPVFYKRLFFSIFYFLFFTLLFACTRLPNIQGKGEVFLQGIWQQDSVAKSSTLLNYTQHNLKITCDSFYLAFTTHAKVNYYDDACFNKGIWKEFAKGTYLVKGDTLILNGTFTKANYKQKVSGCYRNGRYLANFKIKTVNKTSLLLENLNDHKQYPLSLTEKTICTQKEL